MVGRLIRSSELFYVMLKLRVMNEGTAKRYVSPATNKNFEHK